MEEADRTLESQGSLGKVVPLPIWDYNVGQGAIRSDWELYTTFWATLVGWAGAPAEERPVLGAKLDRLIGAPGFEPKWFKHAWPNLPEGQVLRAAHALHGEYPRNPNDARPTRAPWTGQIYPGAGPGDPHSRKELVAVPSLADTASKKGGWPRPEDKSQWDHIFDRAGETVGGGAPLAIVAWRHAARGDDAAVHYGIQKRSRVNLPAQAWLRERGPKRDSTPRSPGGAAADPGTGG